MGKTLEGLRFYQAAETICDEIWQEVVQWKQFSRDTAGKQLVQSSDSIGANIAEGYGRYHYREDIRLFSHSPQSTIYLCVALIP